MPDPTCRMCREPPTRTSPDVSGESARSPEPSSILLRAVKWRFESVAGGYHDCVSDLYTIHGHSVGGG